MALAAPEASTVAHDGSKIVYLDGESTVLTVALRQHDRVCRQHSDCPRRSAHALESAGKVREILDDLAAVADYAF